MRSSILAFVVLLTSAALAVEPVDGGKLNGLEARQSYDYCGMDVYGIDWYCTNSLCCVGSTGWSCVGANDQCCTTGFMCPGGSSCYLDSAGYQWCVSGSSTITANEGSAAQTQTGGSGGSGSSPTAAPTPTSTGSSGAHGGVNTIPNSWVALLGALVSGMVLGVV